jgi:hypothetical protein
MPRSILGKFWKSVIHFEDEKDRTRKVQFDVSAISNQTIRTVSFPDADVTIPSGTIMSTTAKQTLTNKTIALGSNTITGTEAQFNASLAADSQWFAVLSTSWSTHANGVALFTGTNGKLTYNSEIKYENDGLNLIDNRFGEYGLQVTNSSTGATAYARVDISADSGTLETVVYPAAKSTSGAEVADAALIRAASTLAGGLNIVAAGASAGVGFYAGGSAAGDLVCTFASDQSATFAGTVATPADMAADEMILSDLTNKGLKVGDISSSTYPWRDITGQILIRGSGPTDPSWTQITGGTFWAYDFAISDLAWVWFHIPHDIVPGSDIHLHVHWLPSGTDVNTVKWEFTYSHALGFNQAAFDNTGTVITAEEAGPGVARQHMITETAAITIASLTEPDGLLAVRLSRLTNGGTDNTDTIFVLNADVHYQSTNIGTLNKAPGFYGT